MDFDEVQYYIEEMKKKAADLKRLGDDFVWKARELESLLNKLKEKLDQLKSEMDKK